MKRTIGFILSLLMLTTLFGCAGKQSASNELWIVTEATTWDRMNGQVAVVAEQFEADNPGVTVRIDILPTESQERSVYIQQLRTKILRGQGPDVYLLPTSTELMTDAASGYEKVSVEPLFPDVVQAMTNGMFRDISSLYNADEDLGKESLQKTVMDAGVLEGKRYVLPLRYDIPVLYVDRNFAESRGISTEIMTQNVDQIMMQAVQWDDPALAGAFSQMSTAVFTQWLDYANQSVSLDADTIAIFLGSYQALQAQTSGELKPSVPMNVNDYCRLYYQDMGEDPYRIYAGTLADLLEYAPVYQFEEQDLMVLPMRSIGGDVVANVTYYGAVGSGCQDPERAYEFLRMFLLEESQWEANRPQSLNAVGEKGRKVSTTNTTQVPGLIEEGWPVRSQGSLDSLWNTRKRQFYNHKAHHPDPEIARRMRKIGMSQLDSQWSQILATEPDQVRFGSSVDQIFLDTLAQLNDPVTNAPRNVDVHALAEDFWWQLRWHVAEG